MAKRKSAKKAKGKLRKPKGFSKSLRAYLKWLKDQPPEPDRRDDGALRCFGTDDMMDGC